MEFLAAVDAAPPHSLFPLFADKHKDGTSIILELEKGLRSTKIGEQCESIAFFARLIAQYPFAVVVNTAVLKLADLFRQSNNFVRYCILRVFQTCEEQLLPGNILNLDEILRRLTSVLHSNDPLARALTLRYRLVPSLTLILSSLLSSLSLVIADRLDMQHWIRKCFDSQHPLEIDATLALMDRVAARSESFCVAMLAKAVETINALETSMTTRLRLIRLFRHMHHSSALAHEVEQRCTELLQVHTLRACAVALLDTLTALAERVAALAPRQVSLLWQTVTSDPRRVVQERALVCLATLATKPRGTEHLWRLIETSPYDSISQKAASVLASLATAAADEFFSVDDVVKHLALIHTKKAELSTILAHVFATIVSHPVLATKDSNTAAHAADVLAAQLCLIISLHSAQPNASLPYLSLVKTLRAHSSCRISVIRALLPLLSPSVSISPNIAHVLVLVAEIDCAAAAQVSSHTAQLLGTLSKSTNAQFNSRVCELLLRASPTIASSLVPVVDRTPGWATYILGRTALCSGVPATAVEAFSAVAEKVGTEQQYAWLLALRDLARAEVSAQSARSTTQALSALSSAVAHLQGAASPFLPLHFQTKFISFRRSFLSAVSSLRLLLQEMPRAPVILYSVRDSRTRAVVERISSARRVFTDLAAEVALLSHSHFDIDPSSLAALQTHANLCATIASLVRTWFEASNGGSPAVSPAGSIQLNTLCSHLLAESTKVGAELSTRADALLEALQLLCACSPPYPRFFFRCSPGTVLKITVAPRPHSHSEALLVQSTVTLVLRISGVLFLAPQVRRRAHHVSLVVRVTEVAQGLKLKNLRLEHIRGSEISLHTLQARLQNKAFSTSCLLRFPVPTRTYLVSVQPALIASGEEWPMQTEAMFVRTADAPTAATTPPTATTAT